MNEMPSSADILTQLNLQPVSQQLLKDYPPVPCTENGNNILHEESHILRVTLYADLICQALENQGIEVNRHAILSAIRIHDSDRIDDHTNDKEHGLRAAWDAYNTGLFQHEKDENLILELTCWHTFDNEEIRAALELGELPLEYQIILDADALDRIRDQYLHPDGEQFDKSYLRLDTSRYIMPVAEALCYEYFDPYRPRQTEVTADLVSVGQNLGIIERAL